MANTPEADNKPAEEVTADGKAALDPKTALLIEQTEKSLKQMEQSLGPDHPVIAQLLDTYAKILRQANTRQLDALNMEARAKAIRARNNIPEPGAGAAQSVKASETLEFAEPIKPIMSASQAKIGMWVLAGVIGVGMICFAGSQMRKPPLKKPPVKAAAAQPTEVIELAPVGGPNEEPSPAPEAAEQTPQPVDPATSTIQAAKDELTAKQKMLELANAGQAAEDSGELDKAEEAYTMAIGIGGQASHDTGRTIICEATAHAFEGLARIARGKGDDSKASEYETNAASIRQTLQRQAE